VLDASYFDSLAANRFDFKPVVIRDQARRTLVIRARLGREDGDGSLTSVARILSSTGAFASIWSRFPSIVLMISRGR